jgi:hypothetical protein
MKTAEQPSPENLFQDCSAERVFADMSTQVNASEVRTLWLRLKTELDRQGVAAATTYLNAEFMRLKGELIKEINAVDNR